MTLIDFLANDHKLQKYEILIDIFNLQQSANKTITKAIEEHLEKNKLISQITKIKYMIPQHQ